MVGPVGTQSANQLSVQFLNNVLSQRGPSALPYEEEAKWLIRQHLVGLVQHFPSLQVKTATFTHNDGRSVNLLQAEGTIPMVYHDVVYNIPAVVWLVESYPRLPPLVFVTPTRDMIIKRAHPNVNPSGLVSVPYLQHWVYPSSNLVDLVKNLSHHFGLDPPLYTTTSATAVKPPPQRPSTSEANLVSFSLAMTSSNSGSVRPVLPPRTYSSPYGRLPPSPQRPTAMEDPSEVYKRNAINRLLEMLHNDAMELRKAREAEVDVLFNSQAVLREREEQLTKGLREMQDEKEALEQQLQIVLTNTDVLEAWLKENEDKKEKAGVVDIDHVFEPIDALSKQMLECTAADLAIEDVIYSLDKAVQEGAIPFDAYLKSIRALSREQFFYRATSAKVRAAQMQAQVAGMAARVSPQYAV
ncbi:hypothetical protein AMTRI_Chr13g121130 [Amborella trichopoda]